MSELATNEVVVPNAAQSEALREGRRPQAESVAITRPPATMVLEGELGKEDLPQLADMLFRVAHRGVTRIVIDFAGVTHFDFRGVKPLVQRAELFRKAGGDIKLSGLSPYLHAIFRSAGGAGAFDFYAEQHQAVSAFARG